MFHRSRKMKNSTCKKKTQLNCDRIYELHRKGFGASKRKYESQHEISNNVVCATRKASDQPAQTGSLI